MKSEWIIDVFAGAINDKIGDEWKHDVGVYGMSSDHVNFEVDGKEYVIVLKEVEDGHNFSEYLREARQNG